MELLTTITRIILVLLWVFIVKAFIITWHDWKKIIRSVRYEGKEIKRIDKKFQ